MDAPAVAPWPISESWAQASPEAVEDEPQFLFDVDLLDGPLEELHAAFDRRLQRCESLGETEAAERFRRAYDLARVRLESRLSGAIADTPPGAVPDERSAPPC